MLAISTPGAVFICAIPSVVVLLGLGIAIFCWRRTRLLSTVPSPSDFSMEEGLVGLEGRTVNPWQKAVQAPLTRAACCWYHYSVEQYRRDESSGEWSWSTLEERTSEQPFEITDGMRPCIVWPANAKVMATDKSVWSGTTRYPEDRNPERDRPDTRSASQWNAMSGGSQDTPYRYTEERIYAGDEAFVLGWFNAKMAGPSTSKAFDEPSDESDDEDIDDDDDEEEDWETDEDDEQSSSKAPTLLSQHAGKGSVSKPSGKQPFLIFAMNKAEAIQLHQRGIYAGLFLAGLGGVGVMLASKNF